MCPAQGWKPEAGMEVWALALGRKSVADQGTSVGFVFKSLYIQGVLWAAGGILDVIFLSLVFGQQRFRGVFCYLGL